MFVEQKDILFCEMGENITMRLLGKSEEGTIMAGEMIFDKDAANEPHSHPDHEQFVYVIRGKVEFTCGDEKRVCGPGDCMYAKRGEIHATRGLEDGSAILDLHYPLRPDLITRCRPAVETDRRVR